MQILEETFLLTGNPWSEHFSLPVHSYMWGTTEAAESQKCSHAGSAVTSLKGYVYEPHSQPVLVILDTERGGNGQRRVCVSDREKE